MSISFYVGIAVLVALVLLVAMGAIDFNFGVSVGR